MQCFLYIDGRVAQYNTRTARRAACYNNTHATYAIIYLNPLDVFTISLFENISE